MVGTEEAREVEVQEVVAKEVAGWVEVVLAVARVAERVVVASVEVARAEFRGAARVGLMVAVRVARTVAPSEASAAVEVVMGVAWAAAKAATAATVVQQGRVPGRMRTALRW